MEATGLGVHHPDVGRVFGSYRVLALLGEGGMGLVYLAEHVRLGRKVALKRLKERYVARSDLVQSFFEEARAVNRINHPNIVEITDFVKDEDQAFYIMEFLEGRSLAQVIQTEGIMEVRRSLDIAHQVAEALGAAHQEGIVHMDIKPSNIFLTNREGRDDYVKLLDFGVAQLEEKPGPVTNDTDPSVGRQRLGTPVYMSPEQFQGTQVDLRSDLYSLGVVLYEMFSGEPPFRASSTAEYAYKHMNATPVPLTKLKGFPHRIARACSLAVMKCLAKNPEDRFGSADELKKELQNAGLTTGVVLKTDYGPILAEPPSQKKLGVAVAAAVTLMLATGITGLLVFGGSPESHGKDSAKSQASPAARDARPDAELVTVEIKSTPSGAEVVRVSPDGKMLGMTPLKLEVARSKKRWRLSVGRKGYEKKHLQLVPDKDRVVVLELQPERAPKELKPDGGTRPDETDGEPSTSRRRRRGRERARDRARARGRKKPDDTTKTIDPFKR